MAEVLPTGFAFRLPRTVLYGVGALRGVKDAMAELGAARPFVVTDRSIVRTAAVAAFLASLREAGLTVELFPGINAEPTSTDVVKGVEAFKSGPSDLILAIGGGSCIDAAKGIAALAANGGEIADFEGVNRLRKAKIPLIAVSTTAGTGSEVTAGAVITDPKERRKMIMVSPLLIPEVSVSDPTLTLSMPPSVTAYTGIDALTHAIEGFLTKRAQPLTDGLALQALSLIVEHLPAAVARPDDLEARNGMMLGQMLAGMVISHTGTALVHAMARPFGVYFGVPHGLSNAVFLRHAMTFTAAGGANARVAAVLERFGSTGCGPEETDLLLRKFLAQLHVPSLSDLKIDTAEYLRLVPRMAEDAVASGGAANNARPAGVDEIVALYRRALE